MEFTTKILNLSENVNFNLCLWKFKFKKIKTMALQIIKIKSLKAAHFSTPLYIIKK